MVDSWFGKYDGDCFVYLGINIGGYVFGCCGIFLIYMFKLVFVVMILVWDDRVGEKFIKELK